MCVARNANRTAQGEYQRAVVCYSFVIWPVCYGRYSGRRLKKWYPFRGYLSSTPRSLFMKCAHFFGEMKRFFFFQIERTGRAHNRYA